MLARRLAEASPFKMTEVSRHKSLDTLRGPVRRVDLFGEHGAAQTIGAAPAVLASPTRAAGNSPAMR
jgi:hypothetical protein